MNTERIRELLNEIEKKSYQVRAVADGMASMGSTICKENDAAHICFTGTAPEEAFCNMALIVGDLQLQISEHIHEILRNISEC